MATRGAIARLTHALPPKWEGRCHDCDSSPSSLGKTLWCLYHGHFHHDLDRMLHIVLDSHPAHHGQFDCHNVPEDAEPVTDETAATLGVEWAYVFTSAHALEPTGHTRRYDTLLILSSVVCSDGKPQVHWRTVAVVDLNGLEPDWQGMEAAPQSSPTLGAHDAMQAARAKGAHVVQWDEGRRGIYIVRLDQKPLHYVNIMTERDGISQIFCTCSAQEEAESPDCAHAKAVLEHMQQCRAAALERQQRGLRYSGSRVQAGEGDSEVMVNVWEAGWPCLLDPQPSQRLRNHSPCGFEWSYAGSGPAQLALAILLDFGGEEELALSHYQTFKTAHVATLPRDGVWELTGEQVEIFLQARSLQREDA